MRLPLNLLTQTSTFSLQTQAHRGTRLIALKQKQPHKVSLQLEYGVLQRFEWFCFFFFPNKNFLNLLHRTRKGLKTSKQESPFVPSHSALCWVSKRHPTRQLCFRPMCVLVAQSCPTLQPHGLQPTRHITIFFYNYFLKFTFWSKVKKKITYVRAM